MAFNPINQAPGVFIQEIDVPGPIKGVGTSTAAFVGAAEKGPINKPTLITSFTQFEESFGSFITAPQIFVTHAVKGFFDNGGAVCQFVRVGTAVRAWRNLDDNALIAQALVVRAKEEGAAGNAITVEVQHTNLVAAVDAVRAEATLANASNNQAIVTVAADTDNFSPGDIVFLDDTTNHDRAIIDSISGDTITFRANLNNSYTGGTIRIADLETGQTTIRIVDSANIESGTYISITQDATTENGVVQSVLQLERGGNQYHFITLAQGLANTYTMENGDDPVTVQTLEFTLLIDTPGSGVETFPNLSMDPRHSRYFPLIVNSASVDVELADPPTPTLPPDNRPDELLVPSPLTGGQDDDLSLLLASHFNDAIDELERVDEVNMLLVPDRVDQAVQSHMILHCEKMQDRFAILDPQANATLSGIGTQRNQVSSANGYAALYYPRICISNPMADGQIKVPPSGHIAGVYARTDETQGVHKAPANESLRGVMDLEQTLTETEIGLLNEQSINVLRSFPGQGALVWGARTLTTTVQWRYINVRRLLLYIEESLKEGTQFAVFEPNNLELWQTLKRQITEFLTRIWRDGALFGATPDQAFRVTIDEVLNPPSARALGVVTIEVALVPTAPAEFIVFRIIQDTSGSVLQE